MRNAAPLLLVLVSSLVLAASPARAQDSLDELADSPSGAATAPRASVNGYVANRLSYTHVDVAGPSPTRNLPSIVELLEANAQLRVNLGSESYFVSGDLSLAYQAGWLYFGADGSGNRVETGAPTAAALRPFVVPSELYLSLSPRPYLNVVLGKKRVTWGSGFAFNPMDLVSPAKDPTDPSSQRSGPWMAKVEVPLERMTVTALFSPQELATQDGIPYALLRWSDPGEPGHDDASHYLLAGRVYLLVADTDVNLVYAFSNRYQDVFEDKSRVGLSVSRSVFGDFELHLEALLNWGSGRGFPNHACATGSVTCVPDTAFTASKARSSSFYPRMVLGGRWQITQESFLSLEYYFQGDGYTDAEFSDAVTLLDGAYRAGLSTGGTVQGGGLQRYAFDPLRRHYLIASYTSPRLFDDWTVNASLIAGLRDLSGLLTASVSWSAREWLTVTAYGYAPIRGLGVGEARVGERSYSEYSLQPFDARFSLELRAFY